jgi:hypothetical protein
MTIAGKLTFLHLARLDPQVVVSHFNTLHGPVRFQVLTAASLKLRAFWAQRRVVSEYTDGLAETPVYFSETTLRCTHKALMFNALLFVVRSAWAFRISDIFIPGQSCLDMKAERHNTG